MGSIYALNSVERICVGEVNLEKSNIKKPKIVEILSYFGESDINLKFDSESKDKFKNAVLVIDPKDRHNIVFTSLINDITLDSSTNTLVVSTKNSTYVIDVKKLYKSITERNLVKVDG